MFQDNYGGTGDDYLMSVITSYDKDGKRNGYIVVGNYGCNGITEPTKHNINDNMTVKKLSQT